MDKIAELRKASQEAAAAEDGEYTDPKTAPGLTPDTVKRDYPVTLTDPLHRDNYNHSLQYRDYLTGRLAGGRDWPLNLGWLAQLQSSEAPSVSAAALQDYISPSEPPIRFSEGSLDDLYKNGPNSAASDIRTGLAGLEFLMDPKYFDARSLAMTPAGTNTWFGAPSEELSYKDNDSLERLDKFVGRYRDGPARTDIPLPKYFQEDFKREDF